MKLRIHWSVFAALLGVSVTCLQSCKSAPPTTLAGREAVATGHVKTTTPEKRPNILLIVADDLGYSDISPYGSEVNTPNLETIAHTGVKFTHFYSAPTCSPTRAMLMTGVDSHLVGLGTMAERMTPELEGKPGYEGVLNDRAAVLPEVLQSAGYHTYMAGKWHLGTEKHNNPKARGFERSYGLLGGAGFHLNDRGYRNLVKEFPLGEQYAEDGAPIKLPEDFYSTKTYTEKLIEFIEYDRADNKPFFAYLALTAPHWPLQAPASSRDKYAGKYDDGYDVWYERRLASMKRAGVVPEDASVFPRLEGEKPWDKLSEKEKKYSARKMEVQAAMIDEMDKYIGILINYLKATDQYENTFILFMSDNGVEGRHIDRKINAIGDWVSQCCDNSLENIGAGDSFVWLGPNWGRVSSGPLRLWKSSTAEGGIRVPALISFPGRVRGNKIADQVATVKDVMPTLLELADIDTAMTRIQGSSEVLPIQGKSLWPFLSEEVDYVHSDQQPLGWELSGKKALLRGNWKLLWDSEPFGTDGWTLYHLASDPGEMKDLSAIRRKKFLEMKAYWNEYQKVNNVVVQ